MGDNAEHRDGPQSGYSGDGSGAVNVPLTQTHAKSRADFQVQKPE